MGKAIKSVLIAVVLLAGIGAATPVLAQVESLNYDNSPSGKAGQALENLVLASVAESVAKQNALLVKNSDLYLEQAPKLVNQWFKIRETFAGAKGFDLLDRAMYAHRSMILYHRTGVLTEEIALALYKESYTNLEAYLAQFKIKN